MPLKNLPPFPLSEREKRDRLRLRARTLFFLTMAMVVVGGSGLWAWLSRSMAPLAVGALIAAPLLLWAINSYTDEKKSP